MFPVPDSMQRNPSLSFIVILINMEERYSWSWVEAEVCDAIEAWNRCAVRTLPPIPRFACSEQRRREKAYDQGLRSVEREARRVPRTLAERRLARQRIVDAFPHFAAIALGLKPEAVELLTGTFLRVGAELARWARSFDPFLTVPDTIQACRNAWTACGLQALFGQPMQLTPSLVAYSMLYPYSDNYLDHPSLSSADKHRFSERFRQRLCGQHVPPSNSHEASVWTMVQLIEGQYPRQQYPQIFDSLLAIHKAQEQSIVQLRGGVRFGDPIDLENLLRISCAKGGTSVLTDACVAKPWLTAEESKFSFEWGVLLQLGDDLQDVQEDLRRGSVTLFTRAAAAGQPLDNLVVQLLNFSQHVANSMDHLPHGSATLKDLLRMSWHSLILMAVADAQQFFSKSFLAELEPCSAFRFNFLRSRNKNLAGRESFYAVLFDAFVEAGADDASALPVPRIPPQSSISCIEPALAGQASEGTMMTSAI
jgi:hypothetical protein